MKLSDKPISPLKVSESVKPISFNSKNIPSNTNVMGYPAKNIRNFLKENKFYD